MSDENAAANNADSAGQQEGSAPLNNNSKTQEANSNASASRQDGGTQKGVKREFFNLREKVRTEREEKEALRSELDALKAQLAGSVGGKDNRKPDPLEDPEAYSGIVEKRAEEAAARKFNELLSQHNVQSSAVHSEQWLRSRSHLEDDNKAADEVAEIIANQYAHLVRVDPRAAARSAYTDWCEMKGVTPDLSGNSNATPPKLARPSSAGSGSSGADKVYTPQEVAKTLKSLSSPEAIRAYSAEVEKAAREGRYKGNFIKL
jgi:hypothetical protein